MNKISVILQDKEAIMEIAKDEDVQIKIKDAILAGVAKRVAHGVVGVDQSTLGKLMDNLKEQLFVEYSCRTLSTTAKHKVQECVDKIISCEVINIQAEMVKEVNERLKGISELLNLKLESYDKSFKSKLESFDFDGAIEKALDKKLKELFNK